MPTFNPHDPSPDQTPPATQPPREVTQVSVPPPEQGRDPVRDPARPVNVNVENRPAGAPHPEEPHKIKEVHAELIIYSHSSLFYWWPVWAVGYAMALVTWMQGTWIDFGDQWVRIHLSNNLGVIFFLTVSLVVVITNIHARGLISGMIIMGAVLVTVLLALFDLWDVVFSWFEGLRIYMNQGAYFWFSTLMLILWLLAFLVFDRMEYWRIKPGQITRQYVFGAGSKSYDTENLIMEKHRDDLFRHWILGLGAGDLHLMPFGSQQNEIEVRNVLFIGSKIEAMQRMIAMQPGAFGKVVIR